MEAPPEFQLDLGHTHMKRSLLYSGAWVAHIGIVLGAMAITLALMTRDTKLETGSRAGLGISLFVAAAMSLGLAESFRRPHSRLYRLGFVVMSAAAYCSVVAEAVQHGPARNVLSTVTIVLALAAAVVFSREIYSTPRTRGSSRH